MVERMKAEALEHIAKQKARDSLEGSSIIGITDMSQASQKKKTSKDRKQETKASRLDESTGKRR